MLSRAQTEAALAAANRRLREADRRKNEFIGMLSHELRNPLTPIHNCVHILKSAPPGEEQSRQALAVLDRQVEHLTRLIEDLLDVTRVTSGKIRLDLESVDLNALVRRAGEDLRQMFVDGDVALAVRTDPAAVWVKGDRTRLSQVLGNLLQNSLKFTPRGGETTVSVAGDAARGQALVRVQDTGRGIAPDMLPRLFEPFTQADSTLDRSKGGLGLGLALVKGVVEMHGGSVTAASVGLDHGATFTITLPLAPASQAVDRERTEVEPSSRRVLVIEDHVDAGNSLCALLETYGHAVQVARSGPEGIERARAFKPAVVLCDIGLPEMDGYEVARRLRAEPELGRVTLVALSGYARPEDVAKAREAGFDFHLAKPPDLAALAKVLAAASEG
jgi:CheY-like chemotaxis protein/nitrogen-specific signal transduction histidine kinase